MTYRIIKIDDTLVLANRKAAMFGKETLSDEFKITHSLNVCASITKTGFPQKDIVIIDDCVSKAMFDKWLDACIAYIDACVEESKENRVMVNCYEGKNRSVTAIVGYYMFKHKLGYDAALDKIKKGIDWQIMTNPTFIKHLRAREINKP